MRHGARNNEFRPAVTRRACPFIDLLFCEIRSYYASYFFVLRVRDLL